MNRKMAHAISHIATQSTSNDSCNEIGVVKKVFVRFKANRQANKIIKGLNEAKQIKAGKARPSKSFNDFLNEL